MTQIATFIQHHANGAWIDIDELELPTEYADINASKSDILAYTTAKLPEAFRGVDCHYQFSASMGVKMDKVRVHLWYWLNRRVSDAEMKAWMGQSDVPVDMTLFRPVQPHFTANPIFENGAINPLPNRSGLYDATTAKIRSPFLKILMNFSLFKREAKSHAIPFRWIS